MEERIERTERSERTERNSVVAPIVHKILFEEAVSSKKPRVAAYCRVSTDLEEQATSFAMQVRTYEERIKSNPDWEFAGIFADEGITGTSAAKRPQFQAMIRACDEGKIDIIYTKSISRFARNTLECLSYVNQLEKDGVAVIFENDRIDTRTKESKLLFTILANFAEEESRSISENSKWGIRKKFEQGIARWANLYGYKKGYVIVPNEATVVQKIFKIYERGNSFKQIKKKLNDAGTPSPKKTKWSERSIQSMLSNERYMGDIKLQKTYMPDHLATKAVRNDSTKVPSYYIDNHHQGIITKKQFKRVQLIREMKQGDRQYPFGSKLRCPYCGAVLHQRKLRSLGYVGWCCEEVNAPHSGHSIFKGSALKQMAAGNKAAGKKINTQGGMVGTIAGTIPVTERRGAEGSGAEKAERCCHQFAIPSQLVNKALVGAYEGLSVATIEAKLSDPKHKRSASALLTIKQQYHFRKVDYWWVDDLIDHIEFGKHSHTPTEIMRMRALGEDFIDDRVMLIFWKCGIVSTVPTGVNVDRDDPRILAARNIPDTKAANSAAKSTTAGIAALTAMTATTATALKTATAETAAIEMTAMTANSTDAEKTVIIEKTEREKERMTGENNENHTYIAQ